MRMLGPSSISRHKRRFDRLAKLRFLFCVSSVFLLFLIYLAFMGFKLHPRDYDSSLKLKKGYVFGRPKAKHRRPHNPCNVELLESVDNLEEPKDFINFTSFSLRYYEGEDAHFGNMAFRPRFGGDQTLEERESHLMQEIKHFIVVLPKDQKVT